MLFVGCFRGPKEIMEFTSESNSKSTNLFGLQANFKVKYHLRLISVFVQQQKRLA
jgi:hypothetical protein